MADTARMSTDGLPANYSMASRLTTLILNRETALALLHRAPADRYVLAAIAALEGEPDAGMPGGRARDYTRQSRSDSALVVPAPIRVTPPPPLPGYGTRKISLRKRPKPRPSRAPSTGVRPSKVPAAFYG